MYPLGGLSLVIILLLSAKFGEPTNPERKLDFHKFMKTMVNYQNRSKDVIFVFDESNRMASFRKIPQLIAFFANTLIVPLITTRIAVVMSSPTHVIHSDYVTYHKRNTSCKLEQTRWEKCDWNTVGTNDTASDVGLKMVRDLLKKSNNNNQRIAILMSDNHNSSKIQSHLTEADRRNGSITTFTVDSSGNNDDRELQNMMTESSHVFLIGKAVLIKELHHNLRKISANCTRRTIKHICKKCAHGTSGLGKPKFKSCHVARVKQKRSAPEKTCKDGYCKNRGTCINTSKGPACKCTKGFKGETCQTKLVNCASKPCKNGGECIDYAEGSKCCCANDYAGEFCERKATECDTVRCFNGGICIDKPGGYECKCKDGFSGEQCEKSHGVACIHHGKIYTNGTQWKEECNNCICEKTQVICTKIKCPKISCKENEVEIVRNGECCRICVPESERCLNNKGDCTYSCKMVGNSYTCSCPDGMRLASNNRSCIDAVYCNDSGRIYLEKELWKTNCETCHCDRGEIICKRESCPPIRCKLNERQVLFPGECCARCVQDSMGCSLFHKGDISTFDGYKYSFRGKCRYSLIRDCVTDKFNIQYVNTPSKVSERTIFIYIRCIEIELSPSGEIFVEKEKISIPYTRSNLVYITPGPGNRYFSTVIFNTIDSITVIWKSMGDIAIIVPTSYKGNLCGLCGNFNGNESDDFFDEYNLPPNAELDSAFEPVKLCSIPKVTTQASIVGNHTISFSSSVVASGILTSDRILDKDANISIETKTISASVPPDDFITKVSLSDKDSLDRTSYSKIEEIGSTKPSGENISFLTTNTGFSTEHVISSTQSSSKRYDASYADVTKNAISSNETTTPDTHFTDKTQDQKSTSKSKPSDMPDSFDTTSAQHVDTSVNGTSETTKDGSFIGSSQSPFQNTSLKDDKTLSSIVNYTTVSLTSVTIVPSTSVTTIPLITEKPFGYSTTDHSRNASSDYTNSTEAEPGEKLLKPDKDHTTTELSLDYDDDLPKKQLSTSDPFPGCPPDAAVALYRSDVAFTFLCSLQIVLVKFFLLLT